MHGLVWTGSSAIALSALAVLILWHRLAFHMPRICMGKKLSVPIPFVVLWLLCRYFSAVQMPSVITASHANAKGSLVCGEACHCPGLQSSGKVHRISKVCILQGFWSPLRLSCLPGMRQSHAHPRPGGPFWLLPQSKDSPAGKVTNSIAVLPMLLRLTTASMPWR